jgi:hypothetical protein
MPFRPILALFHDFNGTFSIFCVLRTFWAIFVNLFYFLRQLAKGWGVPPQFWPVATYACSGRLISVWWNSAKKYRGAYLLSDISVSLCAIPSKRSISFVWHISVPLCYPNILHAWTSDKVTNHAAVSVKQSKEGIDCSKIFFNEIQRGLKVRHLTNISAQSFSCFFF